MKLILPIVLLVLFAGDLSPLRAANTVTQVVFTVGATIPDNDQNGLADTRQIVTPITSITDLAIGFSMSGGWAGDLYAYVTHGSGFTVLLNRPGRDSSNSAGSGADQLEVSFSALAPTDIHTDIPTSGSVSGIFQPDARTIDPDYVLDTSPRSAFLSSFTGLDPNGEWTLFVADVVGGDAMVLNEWTLTITGIPEPSSSVLVMLGLLGLLRRRRV